MILKSLITMLLFIGFSQSVFAKEIKIPYEGKAVSQTVNLAKGDVVMINTSVPVNTKVMIAVKPDGKIDDSSFTFTSSLGNVSPNRTGPFMDQMYTGANPGWSSYTYTGNDDVSATFELNP